MRLDHIICPSAETPHSVATARWCAESARPFTIVKDRCYKWLQREGRPDRYIPTREQVSIDVKKLYQKSKQRLASELQQCEGELALARNQGFGFGS